MKYSAKMNSLKKGEGVPLLNFKGGGGGSRGPGPTFTPCPLIKLL